MFKFIKNLFKKEEFFSCIILEGKGMKYLDLSQKQIDKLQEKNKDWTITKKEEYSFEFPLLCGWQMGLEPTTFRTTI